MSLRTKLLADLLSSVFGFVRETATSKVVRAEQSVTGGIGFNGQIVDMDETPDETNTEDYPVGTLFISQAE